VLFGESLNLLYCIFTLLKKCKLITLRYLLFGKLHICRSYTEYILAAAEEFDYKLIKYCSHLGHGNIAILNGHDDPIELKIEETNKYGEYIYDGYVLNSANSIILPTLSEEWLLLYKNETKLYTPSIYAFFDSGFKENNYIDIISQIDPNSFWSKFLYNTKSLNFKISMMQATYTCKNSISLEKDALKIKIKDYNDGDYNDGGWGIISTIINQMSFKQKIDKKKYIFFYKCFQ
jgi:hypothetical protein